MKQLPLAMRLRERATFEAFVPGPNTAAVARLRSLASEPRASVCWLAGVPGVGKSHLLQASCALAASAGHRSLYLPLSQLLSLGPLALDGWQPARLIALDELSMVVGQPEWERSLFTLYREAEEQGATLLAAARLPARGLAFVLPDLQSRFAAAMLLVLEPLDEGAQREALQRRARARGLELPEETALFLQRRFRRELPALYGLLDAIDEAALQAQRRLTVPFIREVLGSQLPGHAE